MPELVICNDKLGALDANLLGVETMRQHNLLIDKVPHVNSRLSAFDYYRKPDGHTSLALISSEEGSIELVRVDKQPIAIEYFTDDPPVLKPIILEPIQSLHFTPVKISPNRYVVREQSVVLDSIGLELFIGLVASKALEKQNIYKVSISYFGNK